MEQALQKPSKEKSEKGNVDLFIRFLFSFQNDEVNNLLNIMAAFPIGSQID